MENFNEIQMEWVQRVLARWTGKVTTPTGLSQSPGKVTGEWEQSKNGKGIHLLLDSGEKKYMRMPKTVSGGRRRRRKGKITRKPLEERLRIGIGEEALLENKVIMLLTEIRDLLQVQVNLMEEEDA